MTQLALTADPIDERFYLFHAAHPQVFDALHRLARQHRDAGATRLSMSMLFELLRSERILAGVSDGSFQLNNDFRSRYARALMTVDPSLVGLFETRSIRADREAS